MASSGPNKNTGARPKVKGRMVPSRYRQAAERAASQSGFSDDSVFESREVSRRVEASFQGATSTPMPVNAREFKYPTLDESSVLGASKDGTGSAAADEFQKNVAKLQKKKGKLNMRALEDEMDILYCTYLQAAFLESQAKLALKARSSNMLEQIHKLVELFVTKLDMLAKVDAKASIIASINEICILCKKQEEVLAPVLEKIPDLDKKLKSLSEAVMLTKNKLPIKDVELPDPSSEKEMSNELRKMCHQLRDFFSSVPQYEDIIASCNMYKEYVELTEGLHAEIKRACELVLRAKQLQLDEAFLKL